MSTVCVGGESNIAFAALKDNRDGEKKPLKFHKNKWVMIIQIIYSYDIQTNICWQNYSTSFISS